MRAAFSFFVIYAALATGSYGVASAADVAHHPAQQELTASSRWQRFVARHGAWAVQWNPTTRTPHRAFGKSIPVAGFTRIDAANVWRAAHAFLQAEREALGLDPQALRRVRAQRVGTLWYVSYVQTHDGMDVLWSEIELRIHDSARVMALGVDFHRDLRPPQEPARYRADVEADVQRNPRFANAHVRTTGGPFVLPRGYGVEADGEVAGDGRAVDRWVYTIDITSDAPEAQLSRTLYVDAYNGRIHHEIDWVRHADVHGVVSGNVQLVLPTGPQMTRLFAHQTVNLGGTLVTTDPSGRFVGDVSGTTTLSMGMRGSFASVNNHGGPNAAIVLNVDPGDTLGLLWDDLNSHLAERDVFYHANLAHDFVSTRDPDFVRIHLPLPVHVNRPTPCQAWFDGTSIHFSVTGNGCVNSATSPATVYHEYGHAVNKRLYQEAGRTGMVNRAADEATADVLAVFMEDHPVFPRGFWGPGTFSRTLQNTARYPDDVVEQEHTDGLILGGAFWDLRQATSAEVAYRLCHFAKWGTPDDLNTGVAFAEWFLEVLLADDNDGDLSNGTPHFEAIRSAFDRHGIGTALFVRTSFAHEPLADQPATGEVLPVFFDLQGSPLGGGSPPQNVQMHYTTDGLQTRHSVDALSLQEGRYVATLPAQPEGTLVKYWFTAFDVDSVTLVTWPFAAPDTRAYDVFLGQLDRVRLDDFESDSGWTVGVLGDNATAGHWERAVPQRTTWANAVVQPGSDHTPTGRFCWVTGPLAGNNFWDHDVDGGRTTLLSPEFDVTSLGNPVVQYWKWYGNDKGSVRGVDTWRVEMSGDGATWVPIENTKRVSDDWERMRFRVADHVPRTGFLQLRFVASDVLPAAIVEALVDDFELFEGSVATPVVLSALEAQQTGAHIDLRWEAHDASGVRAYRVLRGRGIDALEPRGEIVSHGDGAYAFRDALPEPGRWVYAVAEVDHAGDAAVRAHVALDVTRVVPSRAFLSPARPNPFNPVTTLEYGVARRGRVRLDIFDAGGHRVRTLVDRTLEPGAYADRWDGTDDGGRALPSGVYLIRFETPGHVEIARATLLK